MTISLKFTIFKIQAISDDIAVDKGIEFFYEIILYSILIGLPCYELYKGSIKDQEKSE